MEKNQDPQMEHDPLQMTAESPDGGVFSWADGVEEVLIRENGNQREETKDMETASGYTTAEIDANPDILADRVMSLGIAMAVRDDYKHIVALQAEEDEQATDDLHHARMDRDHRVDMPNSQSNTDMAQDNIDDEFMDEVHALYNIAPDDDFDGATSQAGPSSSSTAGQPVANHQPTRPAVETRACTVCTDELPFHELARAPCSHEFCSGCLELGFTLSITDEAMWPFSCCGQAIQAEAPQIRELVSEELLTRYLAKKLEMDTPDRTYCYWRQCSSFIPPSQIEGGMGFCDVCGSMTCVECKGRAHVGACPQSDDTDQLVALAEQEGWKQCYFCNMFVERNGGCNHISKCSHSHSHSHTHTYIHTYTLPPPPNTQDP